MAVGLIVAFWAVSALFILTPGADWAYAISAGLRHRSVLPSVAGLLTGHLLATGLVAAGVAALLAGSPQVMLVLTVAGALYLVWLGIGTALSPPAPSTDDQSTQASSPWRQVVAGAGISGLNPKVLPLFLALLPQFIDPRGAWPTGVQIVLLGLIHVAGCAVVYTVVGAGARRVLRARPAIATVVGRVSGTAMILIGAGLALEQALG